MAILGHDMCQPLQVIIGAHDILARSIRSETERRQLTLIETAATRLADLSTQVVEALRLQQAAVRDDRCPVSLKGIFAELAFEFAERVVGKRIQLRVIPTCAVVFSHRVLLPAILRNLVGNAIDYTTDGGHVLLAGGVALMRTSKFGTTASALPPKSFRASSTRSTVLMQPGPTASVWASLLPIAPRISSDIGSKSGRPSAAAHVSRSWPNAHSGQVPDRPP